MRDVPWPAGAATGVGPMPGTDLAAAADVVFGELPEFPHVPDLPARGVGADAIGRTAALLVDLAVQVVPSGYRVSAHPGRHHRRAVDLLQWDLDELERVAGRARLGQVPLKVQLAGPWTLGARIELASGHRVLTDDGALREFSTSLAEGAGAHIAELAERTGAQPVIELDEPALPDILAGALPTVSGYGTVPSVPAPEVQSLLGPVLDELEKSTGAPVIVRCSGPRPPVAVLRGAGARVIALEATGLAGAPAALLDQIGEAADAGATLLLGLVPAAAPAEPADLHALAEPALSLVDRLGLSRRVLAAAAVPTPTGGLAEAGGFTEVGSGWARRALSLSRDLGKAFVEPPERW